MSNISVLTSLFNKTLISPEFLGFVTRPKQPNEAEAIFGRAIRLGQNESRENISYQVLNPRKKLAGFIAKGATEYSRLGYGDGTMVTQGIGKIATEHSYTLEDVDAISQMAARMGFNGNMIENAQVFMDEISMNPIKLTDAIANSTDISAWFGGEVCENLRQGKVSVTMSQNPNHKVTGILNNPNILQEEVTNDGTGSVDTDKRMWKNKTIQQIVRDITKVSNEIQNEIFVKPDTIIVSQNVLNFLQQNFTNWNFLTNITYEQAIKTALPGLNIIGVYALNNVADFDNKGDRFIMLKREPEWFELQTSSPAIALPMEMKRDTLTMSFKSYTSGIIVKMPSAIRIVCGI